MFLWLTLSRLSFHQRLPFWSSVSRTTRPRQKLYDLTRFVMNQFVSQCHTMNVTVSHSKTAGVMWCQFHQNFTASFFVQKYLAQKFWSHSLCSCIFCNGRVSLCRYRQKQKSHRNLPPTSILAWKGQGVKIKKKSYLWSETAHFKFYFCFQYLKY